MVPFVNCRPRLTRVLSIWIRAKLCRDQAAFLKGVLVNTLAAQGDHVTEGLADVLRC